MNDERGQYFHNLSITAGEGWIVLASGHSVSIVSEQWSLVSIHPLSSLPTFCTPSIISEHISEAMSDQTHSYNRVGLYIPGIGTHIALS